MTSEVINEVLSVHPKAISLNAVRLGLSKEGDIVSSKSLCSAILERQKKDNLTDLETRKLAYSLFSHDAAINRVVNDLIPVSEIEIANSLVSFALGFFTLLLILIIVKSISKIL